LGSIRVYLSCGHRFEVGSLTEEEERSLLSICPTCRRPSKIAKAVRLKHPDWSKKVWVEGESIWLEADSKHT
jgi:hypothetical protein